MSPFSSCTIDLSIDRSGDRPATYRSEPSGHEDERGECRKVLSAAPGNQLWRGREGARKSEGLFGCLQCQEEEKSWSLKGKGPGQKRSSKAILAPHTEIDIVL